MFKTYLPFYGILSGTVSIYVFIANYEGRVITCDHTELVYCFRYVTENIIVVQATSSYIDRGYIMVRG